VTNILHESAVLTSHFELRTTTAPLEAVTAEDWKLDPCLPHRALVPWIHGRSQGTIEGLREVPGIRQRAQNSDRPRRVDR
jgi:hypothetical protein